MQRTRIISYGDPKSHLFLWQKAFYLVPAWAVLIIPVAGLICHMLGPTAMQVGHVAILSLLTCYFFQDLLKRKIRFDDENIFFGFSIIPIKDLIGVSVSYKKHKFLPDCLVLQRASGPNLRLVIAGLRQEDIAVLLKHLQTRNSNLTTAAVLPALVKCRELTQKLPDLSTPLMVPYHEQQVVSESTEIFKSTALQWARVGPVIAFVACAPVWLSILSGMFTTLSPHYWEQMRSLTAQKTLSDLSTGLNHAILTNVGQASDSIKHFASTPWVAFCTSALIVGLVFYLRVLLRPNNLVANNTGLKLLFCFGNISIPVRSISWAQIKGATLRRLPGRAGATAMKIRFTKMNEKYFDLNLAALTNEHRSFLLKRIEKQCPTCQIDPELSQSMQPKSERSYTELWLQSLTQAPERKTLDPLQPGQVIGENRFEVLKQLGVGGQGTAYLCIDLLSDSGVTVVLKESVLPTFVDHAVRRKTLERFEQEAKLLKPLDSSHIVKLLDYFVEDHRSYLVLEYIEGCTLRELIEREGPVDQARAFDIALQMCDILKLLHEHAIVHRDFAPDNLILRNDGKLKLIDFNVAQQIQTGATGTIVGKHAYLPPEQFRGKPTTQSDLYAMGATLFFLLTGRDPEPISQSSPAAVNPNISAELDQIVKRATALQASSRYQTANEVASDLLTISASDHVLSTHATEREMAHNG